MLPGVYAVGYASRERPAALWAARLFAGPEATFSHRAAAELNELPTPSTALIVMTLPISRRSRAGIRFHVSSLPGDERTTVGEHPATTTDRMVLDLAPELSDRRLERLLEECERRALWGPLGPHGILKRYPGRRGAGRLRRVLERWQPGESWTRSELEEAFIGLLDARGITRGEANRPILTDRGWFECDHVWRRQRVIVELDSRSHHHDDPALERDSAKRRALTVAGWRVVVVTWRQIALDPDVLERELRALLEGS